VVKALSAPPEDSRVESPTPGSATSTAVRDCLVCLISGDVMRDPVTVVESGITYDRELVQVPSAVPRSRALHGTAI
jgi:hypothetical protein